MTLLSFVFDYLHYFYKSVTSIVGALHGSNAESALTSIATGIISYKETTSLFFFLIFLVSELHFVIMYEVVPFV